MSRGDAVVGYARVSRGAGTTLLGGSGTDRLIGGDGADTLKGGGGSDTLFGGPAPNWWLSARIARVFRVEPSPLQPATRALVRPASR